MGWGGPRWGGPYTSFITGLSSPSPQGQRPCDLADEDVLSLLEELAQKQEDVSLGQLRCFLSAPWRLGFLVSYPYPDFPMPTTLGTCCSSLVTDPVRMVRLGSQRRHGLWSRWTLGCRRGSLPRLELGLVFPGVTSS